MQAKALKTVNPLPSDRSEFRTPHSWGTLTLFLLALGAAASATASGILIPKEPALPALAIKNQRVSIAITDAVAETKVTQTFLNSTSRELEATYVFPLPANAAISEFVMVVNGKRVKGELLDKDKARSVYEEIVRRTKDPGLLEHMGGRLFRVRVYPVPARGEQEIELSYSQTLPFNAGLYEYVYPLRTADRASATLEDFTISATLKSSVPLRTIYSPSHNVDVRRTGEQEATIGFEEDRSTLDRDFRLLIGVSDKDLGLNLLTYRTAGQSGFFMLMLTPRVTLPTDCVVHRDIAFVLDTSGSMAGNKIWQAQAALSYCIRKLNPHDRFAVMRFSTDVQQHTAGFVPANEHEKTEALRFVEQLEARGGTAIDAALRAASALERQADRPTTIVFLTDGKPTVGTVDTQSIVKHVAQASPANTRIFVFGVGKTVNTHLLDRIAGENGGASHYVKPGEDIEVKVSSFYDKIAQPVLANPVLTIERIKARDLHPRTLPDLFAGTQAIVLGRYEGDGHVAIRLTGNVNKDTQTFVYEASFPKQNADNTFLPRLWATRRIGYLLDQIRLHGENPELKGDVLRLSREYGVMTPYTSFLVVPDEQGQPRHPAPMEIWKSGSLGARPSTHAAPGAEDYSAATAPIPLFSATDGAVASGFSSAYAEKARIVAGSETEIRRHMARKDGLQSIRLSETIAGYRKRARSTGKLGKTVRYVRGRVFYLVNGVWIDRDYRKGMTERKIRYATPEYFALIRNQPNLTPFLTLGPKVIVCTSATHAIVVQTP